MRGKTAFVFAGQGSQAPGMARELYDDFASARKVFDMAGADIKTLCFEGPKERLDVTVNTQPCLFAACLACARVLEESGIYAQGAAGFSLGEIPAAAYCGIMSDRQAFDFVKFRAENMNEAAEKNKGEMYAVLKLSAGAVTEVCKAAGDAYPVNFNCESQTVVACGAQTSHKLLSLVSQSGGKAVKLAVSGAFHSPFMNEAYEKLAEYLQGAAFGEMRIPLYANITAMPYENPGDLLARQVKSPVLWQKTVEHMIADGFDTFVELGPGKTLSGLIKKINPEVTVLGVNDLKSLDEACKILKGESDNV